MSKKRVRPSATPAIPSATQTTLLPDTVIHSAQKLFARAGNKLPGAPHE